MTTIRARALAPLAGALTALASLAVAPAVVAQDGFHWMRGAAGVPPPRWAFVGGEENGAPLVVCRAPYLGGLYPGKLVNGACNIGYDGREIPRGRFDILVGAGAHWDYPQPGYGGALVAGYENGGPLYLCQANFRGGLHPGKIYRDACDISYGGREIPIRRFGVLYGADSASGDFGYAQRYAYPVWRGGERTVVVVKVPYAVPYPAPYRAAPPRPPYDDSAAVAQRARDIEAQRRDERQRADYLRNQQYQRDLAAHQQDEQQRAAFQANQARQQAEEAARQAQIRAGEADENRQAAEAQAKAAEEARRQDEIRAGEADENRQAAEAEAKAAEEARRQDEIKAGEAEENRQAAEAQAKADEDAKRQEEIKAGEEDENRQAAEAQSKAEEEATPKSDDSTPPDTPNR